MNPRNLDFSDVHLYAVTPDKASKEDILSRIDALLKGGVDAIQLRSRVLSDREFLNVGKEIQDKCHASGALFIVDNRVDLALALDADGVHLGHTDMPIEKARDIIGHRKIIGASSHSVPEALMAQRAGADYVSCGPIWSTPTKPDYKAVGLSLIQFYRASMKIPFVAIGSIDESNLNEVLDAGARSVAMVRALFSPADPLESVQRIKNKILEKIQPVKI